VSSAEETAKDVYRVLVREGPGRDPEAPPPVHQFLATGDPEPFARLGRRFLGPEIGRVARRLGSAGRRPAAGAARRDARAAALTGSTA
jgi:glutamate racemase